MLNVCVRKRLPYVIRFNLALAIGFAAINAHSANLGDAIDKWKSETEKHGVVVDICKINPKLCEEGALEDSERFREKYIEEWLVQ